MIDLYSSNLVCMCLSLCVSLMIIFLSCGLNGSYWKTGKQAEVKNSSSI